MIRSLLVASVIALTVVATGCDQLLVDPAPGSDAVALSLGLAGADAVSSGGALEAFKKADRVWIRVKRVSTGVQFDTIVKLSRDETTARVQLAVSADQGRGPIEVATQVRLADKALFEGATLTALEVGVPQRVEIALAAVPAGLSVPASVATLTAVGDSVRLSAAVLFATGDTIPGLPITWSSDNPDVAAVTSTNWVIARSEGEANLTASYASFSAVQHVHVESTVAGVLVTPEAVTLSVGEVGVLHAMVVDAAGTTTDRAVEWISARPEVVSVDQTGHVTALSVGIARVVAQVGDVRGEAVVRVIP